jgi:hypothetical protein
MNPTTDLLTRSSGGVDVALMWNRASGALTLVLADRRHDSLTELPVPPERATYAFNHPYAYRFEQAAGARAA